MSEEITFDFACRDDCLDQMVPSDLRQVVAERDRLRNRLIQAEAERDALQAKYTLLVEVIEILISKWEEEASWVQNEESTRSFYEDRINEFRTALAGKEEGRG